MHGCDEGVNLADVKGLCRLQGKLTGEAWEVLRGYSEDVAIRDMVPLDLGRC